MGKTEKYTLSREIEANEEIRSTQISRRLAVVACTLFMLMITAVPVVQFVSKGMPKKWTDDALRTSCYMENALGNRAQFCRWTSCGVEPGRVQDPIRSHAQRGGQCEMQES